MRRRGRPDWTSGILMDVFSASVYRVQFSFLTVCEGGRGRYGDTDTGWERRIRIRGGRGRNLKLDQSLVWQEILPLYRPIIQDAIEFKIYLILLDAIVSADMSQTTLTYQTAIRHVVVSIQVNRIRQKMERWPTASGALPR